MLFLQLGKMKHLLEYSNLGEEADHDIWPVIWMASFIQRILHKHLPHAVHMPGTADTEWDELQSSRNLTQVRICGLHWKPSAEACIMISVTKVHWAYEVLGNFPGLHSRSRDLNLCLFPSSSVYSYAPFCIKKVVFFNWTFVPLEFCPWVMVIQLSLEKEKYNAGLSQ